MKRYVFLAALGFAILAFSAVWLGGLNQDEGWYLYAANLVRAGERPYRDFFFTQGPVLPLVYSVLTSAWTYGGILGARLVTLTLGLFGLLLSVVLVRRLVPTQARGPAGVAVFLLLGCNLYHLYYLTIPKTYALASLFVWAGYLFLSLGLTARRFSRLFLFGSGVALAFAAGTRISLAALSIVIFFALLGTFRVRRAAFVWFGLGSAFALALVYGPFLLDPVSRAGLFAAQRYHAARGGFDFVFTIGSLSRLVRWYAPLFFVVFWALFGLWRARAIPAASSVRESAFLMRLLVAGFAAVAGVQLLAPFPYEDYQVPVIGLLAVAAVARLLSCEVLGRRFLPFMVLFLAGFAAFGNPLLESWMTNGQDRFWTRKRTRSQLAQLRDMARIVQALDPDGEILLTQDLYLAIEARRRVPRGLEMGPFSMLDEAEWRKILSSAEAPIAALSGYSFAICPPSCEERPLSEQLAYWSLLKENYELVLREEHFGQNATTLLVLKRKASERMVQP